MSINLINTVSVSSIDLNNITLFYVDPKDKSNIDKYTKHYINCGKELFEATSINDMLSANINRKKIIKLN